MRRISLPALVVCALLGLAPAAQSAAAATTLTVAITKSGFSPRTATLAFDSQVIWKNEDTTSHQVVANDGSFASPVLAPGKTYAFTFTRAGTFRYHDGLHPTLTGTLTVNGPPPALTLALDRPIVTFGTPVTLSGRALNVKGGVTVTLFAQPYGQPSPIQLAVVKTAADGSFGYVTTPRLYTTYTASFQTAPAGATMPSNSVVAQVAPKVSLLAGRDGYFRAQVRAAGSLWRRHVFLQRLSAFGQWVNVAALTLDRDSGRVFRAVAYLPRGVSRIRVSLSVNQAGLGLLGAHSGTQLVRRR